jgi:ABC-type spermidine/putrescine transport system permease subunit I
LTLFFISFKLQIFLSIIKLTSHSYTTNWSSSTKIYTRLPKNTEMAWDRYVKPFSNSMWLAVAIVACALGVCLALTNYGHESHRSLSIIATIFYIPACFCQQGKDKHSY